MGIRLIAALFAEEMRHKTLFAGFYATHLLLEHVSPEAAGPFYFVIEVLHTIVA